MSSDIVKSNENNSVVQFKQQLEMAEQLAEIVAKSPIYGKNFEVVIPDTENNLDENGKPTKQITVIRKEDIVSAILLGRELGLSDMVSITFGKTLDKSAYFKVMKGKTLGLDVISSLQHIFVYEKEGQMIIGTDTHAINATIINAGINYEFIVDFKPKKYYRDQKTKIFLDYELDSNWIVVNKGITPATLSSAITQGKLPVLEYITFYSEVILYRKGWKPHTESYSLLDATEAGLYKGLNLNGEEVKGKTAWNAHPKTILNGRVLIIAQRKIGGDVLNGTYSKEEMIDIGAETSDIEITPIEEIKE